MSSAPCRCSVGVISGRCISLTNRYPCSRNADRNTQRYASSAQNAACGIWIASRQRAT